MLAAGGLKIFKRCATCSPELLMKMEPGTARTHRVRAGFIHYGQVAVNYIQTHTFIVFGWYRIALAAGIFCLLLIS